MHMHIGTGARVRLTTGVYWIDPTRRWPDALTWGQQQPTFAPTQPESSSRVLMPAFRRKTLVESRWAFHRKIQWGNYRKIGQQILERSSCKLVCEPTK
jgi:hypothetical protein